MGNAVFVQEGKVINYKNTTAETIPFGAVVVLTDRVGVASFDILPGAMGALEIAGVYEMDAENTTAFAVGQSVYWDVKKNALTAAKADSGAVYAGMVVEEKTQARARALVRL